MQVYQSTWSTPNQPLEKILPEEHTLHPSERQSQDPQGAWSLKVSSDNTSPVKYDQA